jgi:hypothetical protein
MKTISEADRKMVMRYVEPDDVTGCRSEKKGSLMVDIHRECNQISAVHSLPTSDLISASSYRLYYRLEIPHEIQEARTTS